VAHRVSDSGNGTVVQGQHHFHDGLDDADVVDVLSDLRQGHDRRVFVPPVLLGHVFLHNPAESRQHVFFADRGHQSVHTLDSETDFVGVHLSVLVLVRETFFRGLPIRVDFFVDLHHILENHFNHFP